MLTAPFTTRSFRITVPANVDTPAPVAVTRLELSAPRPNPSRGAIGMELALASESDVDLAVFDAAGRRVTTLLSGHVPAGRQSLTWDGRESNGHSAPAGLYFARAVTPHGAASQRIVRVN
jgi:flagellar hook assembly protein FlgD